MRLPLSLGAAALLASCAQVPPPPSPANLAGADQCVDIDPASFGASSATATWVPASESLPAFCEVAAKLNPAPESDIGVVYRLPQAWNGKVLGIGGGGWAGNVTLMAASEGLKKGYATLQTDGGHPGTNPWENSWAQVPAKATDFSHRAIHVMTEAGKKLAATYYGRSHERAYFNGCSTGGRMALMEAQRYPDDYDGIIAGAPVYTLQVQTTGVYRNQVFRGANGEAGFSTADLKLVQDKVMARCDETDGLADGIVNDPRSCRFNPAELQCRGSKTANCLSPAQVTALQSAYDGIRASDGSWAMFPMSRGGEAGWSTFVGTDGKGNDPSGGGGLGGLKPVIFGSRPIDFSAFTDADYRAVRASAFAAEYEAKDADLSGFFDRGGKLLLWHGENDPGPSPVGTNDYARSVIQANPARQTGEQFRYFLLPGVEHCRGGPGADLVDYIDAMDSWVETGRAPDALTGTKADASLTRKHCAWPSVARYSGTGDTNDPASYACVARSSS